MHYHHLSCKRIYVHQDAEKNTMPPMHHNQPAGVQHVPRQYIYATHIQKYQNTLKQLQNFAKMTNEQRYTTLLGSRAPVSSPSSCVIASHSAQRNPVTASEQSQAQWKRDDNKRNDSSEHKCPRHV